MDDKIDKPTPRLPQGSDVVRRSCEPKPEVAPFKLELARHRVDRDDGLPFSFEGYLVGFGGTSMEQPRGTFVRIWVTKGDSIITSVHQWQRDGIRDRERLATTKHATPKDALAWLVADGGGQLGKCSREAWEMACFYWPAFKGLEVEIVE